MKILIILLLLVSYCISGHICVRDGGTGSGTDWTTSNAYDMIPATLTRGDTVFVADGTYTRYVCNDAESGTDSIWILKATESSHGTDTGWLSSYGDGQAEFTYVGSTNSIIEFTTDHWVFDGVVGSDTVGHGFKISYADDTESILRLVVLSSNPTYVYIAHVDMAHAGNENDNGHDSVYSHGCNHVTFSYCWIHDMGRVPFLFRNSNDIIIEYCRIARNEDTDSEHSEGISAYNNGTGPVNRFILRYNIWQDIVGTGVIMHTDTAWQIYGNLIYWTTGRQNEADAEIGGNGVIGTWTGYYCDSAKVYNNTIVDITGDKVYNSGFGYSFGLSDNGHEAYNNIWYNCDSPTSFTDVTHDYTAADFDPGETNDQWPIASSIFSDYANDDFTLNEATDSGLNLGSPYNYDMLGNERTDWDRGYVEFIQGGGLNPSSTRILQMID